MTDGELIEAIRRGDTAAFEELYRRYRDWIVSLAVRTCGNADDALDVLQETFAYLLRKLPELQLRAKMKTFLYPVVTHLAIRRKELARRHLSMGAEPPAREARDESIDPLLADLPEEQREVVRMRFSDGMALAEIAEALSIPLGTVKSRLHTALETLRQKKHF